MKRDSEAADVPFEGVNGGVFKEVLNTASSASTLRTGEWMQICNLICENAEIETPGCTNQKSNLVTMCNEYSSKGHFDNWNINQGCHCSFIKANSNAARARGLVV